MHPCLYVDEIVRRIAHELVASNERAASVALACCCQSFEDPMLDSLWETQSRLPPLLMSLPGDVWNEGRNIVSVPMTCVLPSLDCLIRKSFKRLPTALELARFRKYAGRIRTLDERCGERHMPREVFPVLLQLCATDEPLLPNLKTLHLSSITEEFASFIPLFISPRTTTINLNFDTFGFHKTAVASLIAAFPTTLCPNLQKITLYPLPRDPMITAAVSKMILSCNWGALRFIGVDSPLTEEAREVIFKLPDLRELWVVIETEASLPSMVLPNLAKLDIEYDRDGDWLPMFRGATFGKLEGVAFRPELEQIDDPLEAFEKVALAASIQNTLSGFYLQTSYSRNLKYSYLLPFTRLKTLVIGFPCDDSCSSRVDDNAIMNLARAMPKLESLLLGDSPCGKIPTGVTVKGLAVLAGHCPDIRNLCVHFQVTDLSAPAANDGMASDVGSADPRRDCALTDLEIGDIPVAEVLVLAVAQALVRVFPRIITFSNCTDDNWGKVLNAIHLSRQIVARVRNTSTPQSGFSDTFPGMTLEDDT